MNDLNLISDLLHPVLLILTTIAQIIKAHNNTNIYLYPPKPIQKITTMTTPPKSMIHKETNPLLNWKVAAGVVGVAYAAVLTKILLTNKLLSDNNSWNSWRPELNLEALFDIPAKQLTEQLIKEIQKRYSDEQTPEDFVTPLVKFANQIQTEISSLDSYLTLINFLKVSHLDNIMPETKEILVKARLQKLKYLNSLFKNWNLKYKNKDIQEFYNEMLKSEIEPI